MSKKKKKNPNINRNRSTEANTLSGASSAKKEAVLGKEKKGNMIFIATVVFMAIASGALYFMSSERGNRETVSLQTQPESTVRDVSLKPAEKGIGSEKNLSYEASLFNDGRAKYFQYRYGNMAIKYFILKSSDGVIRAAFDACDVCWPAGKGYYQEGDYMVCRNCGRRFASRLVNVVQGGCNPAPLKRKIVEGRVVITIQDIVNGAGYFNFQKRS